MTAHRSMQSEYMQFAKLRTEARFNLATSGILNCPLAELPVSLQDLEINGPDSYGFGPLLERIAKRYGVKVESVVTSAGTSMANHLAMAATLQPGDDVLIEEPAYDPLLNVASYLGAEIRRFPRRFENGFRIDPDDVKKHITDKTRLVVITNLHNPSSCLTDEATLREVGEIAANAGARVLVDEVYLEMLFERPQRSAFHLGDHFLITNSLTKAYGLSGLRCGWILCEPKLADRIWKLNDLFSATPPYPPEVMAVVAFDNLHRLITRTVGLLSPNRKALQEFLDAATGVEVVRPDFGTTVFPKLKRGNVDGFWEFLRTRFETMIVPGRFFEMQQHFRIGLGGSKEMTAEGLKRLGQALAEYAG